MATTLASNFHRGDFSFDMSSGSHSPSGNASPNPRHASGSMPYLNVPEDNYFGAAVYESPTDTGDSELLLRRLPRRRSADHGDHWNPSDDLLVRHESSDSGAPSPSQSVSSLSSTYTSYDPRYLVSLIWWSPEFLTISLALWSLKKSSIGSLFQSPAHLCSQDLAISYVQLCIIVLSNIFETEDKL